MTTSEKTVLPHRLPNAQPLSLGALVDYAEGSIVSRTVLKEDGGTLTLFAFDVGQELSEHSAPFDAVLHVLDGRAEVIIGGESSTVVAGQVVLMPANVPHAVRAPSQFKALLIMIRSA